MEFRHLFIKLCLLFGRFRIVDDDFYWLSPLFQKQSNICRQACTVLLRKNFGGSTQLVGRLCFAVVFTLELHGSADGQ